MTTFHDKAAIFREALFLPPPDHLPQNHAGMSANRIPWVLVTSKEVRQAIFSSVSIKAPGPDGISFLCIQHAYTAIPQHFNSLYKALLNIGYHPKYWRQAIGAILAKPNKPDYTVPKAYRPIALLNCLGKVAEKIIAASLNYLAEKHHLLDPEQMGGR